LNDQYVTNVAVPIPITVVNDHSGLVSITANSSNLTLVDDSHISFAGSGTNTITISTVAGIPFSLSVTITPTPGMYTQSSLISFVITDANALTQLSSFHYHIMSVFPNKNCWLMTVRQMTNLDMRCLFPETMPLSVPGIMMKWAQTPVRLKFIPMTVMVGASLRKLLRLMAVPAIIWVLQHQFLAIMPLLAPMPMMTSPQILVRDGEANDYFGFSVGISGDYAIVGAYYDDDCGSDCGAAYIFKRNATVWSEFQKITPPDGFTDDRFGYQVEMNNTHAMIGAINTDDQGINSGSAYLYAFNGSSWIFKEKFSSPHDSPGDEFGFSVSLSDHHAMIGALYDDTNNANSGSAYIYQLSSSPMIVDIPTQEISYTTTSLDISITIVNTDGNNVTISAISSDTDIVSNDNISIAGSGLNTYAASTTEGTLDIRHSINSQQL
jgi:hypothetical protein